MTILHSILIKPFYQEGEKTYNFNLGSEALILLVFLQIYQPLVSWDKQKRKWPQIGSSYARRAWEGVFFSHEFPWQPQMLYTCLFAWLHWTRAKDRPEIRARGYLLNEQHIFSNIFSWFQFKFLLMQFYFFLSCMAAVVHPLIAG